MHFVERIKKMAIDFGYERYYNEHGHRFVRPVDPWTALGTKWKKALANPYYILAWQALAVMFQAVA